jgi:hypothetical protein
VVVHFIDEGKGSMSKEMPFQDYLDQQVDGERRNKKESRPVDKQKGKKKRKEEAKRLRQAAVVMEGGGTVVDLGARRNEDRKARRDAIKAKQTGGTGEESA